MLVKEIMTPSLETIKPSENLFTAARIMKTNDIGFLPIVKDGKATGIVTDRDIVVRGLIDGKNPELIDVQSIATKVPITCKTEDNIKEVAQLMKDHQIRRILVVDEKGHPAGALSLGDLAAHMEVEKTPGKVLKEVSKD